MHFTSSFNRLALVPLAFSAFAGTACSDDESAAIVPVSDAGTGDAATGTSNGDASENIPPLPTCAGISVACNEREGDGTVGELCLEIAGSSVESQCAAVGGTCLAFCETGSLPITDAGAPSEEQCHEMGETCHAYDDGNGIGHLCHEVGHSGNVEWCSVIYSTCEQLCRTEASDGGSSHPHDGTDASHIHTPTDTSHHTESDTSSLGVSDTSQRASSDTSATETSHPLPSDAGSSDAGSSGATFSNATAYSSDTAFYRETDADAAADASL